MRLPRACLVLALGLALAACGGSGGSGGSASDDRQEAPTDSRVAGKARTDRRVFLIGLDAADGRLIQQGIEAGRLPNFARILREGAYGPLRTHRPVLSPILWTTMATGLTPDRHGILDFLSVDERGRTVPVTRLSRKAPAFWNILGARGISCGVLGWLASHPAEPVNGFVVSDRFFVHAYGQQGSVSDQDPAGKTYPPELYGSIRGSVVDPSTISDADLQRVFGAPPVARGEDLQERSEMRAIEADARTWADVALALDTERRPDVLAVYFDQIDRLMHLFADAMPPPLAGVPARKSARYGRAVELFYAAMDARLGRLLDAAARGPVPATVIIVSDHGFKIGSERPHHAALRTDVFAAEWHHDPGVILAWGAGIRKGARPEGADIYDVTPMMLAVFGLPASDQMRGNVPAGLFEPGWLPPAPPRVPAYEAQAAPAEAGGNARPSDEENAQLLENLKALGYIGGGANDPGERASANLATFYLEEKQYDRAIEIYRRILSKSPGDLIALYNIGYAFKELGSPAKGAESFERLLKERPDYLEARLILAECYLSLGRGPDALRLLLAGSAEGREDADWQNHLGTVLAVVGRPEDAAAAFERAIRLKPDEASAYLNLARLLTARGDRDGAVAALRRAGIAAPGDGRVEARLKDLGAAPPAPSAPSAPSPSGR
jgi:predicted AlkP superfamily phosphohydrolase/phosphomutase/thioredoxin-like negative regulator of GroEL